ncbi:putative efflux pump antibiotic resistance protein [Truncatella angustata]|uniref:Efflux pump antibiotic resistance protein n=1 Tax=Truncatella angustata TaxID=152316 RepID=A0A9P8UIR5_9PEZI|nr:putative efflux pump antibiotic resistance protein [Truncatella angustata]KAH6653123.1 putative efflux pump antibiotic resistance protein [Truncatella angustata]
MTLLLSAVIFCIFVMSLDMTIVGTAIPKITDDFDGLEQVPWYGSAYFMTFGGFQSSWGKVYRYVPLKITYLLTMALFEIGSLVCATAPNATAFIVGRAIAGLGGAGIAAGGYTVIALSSRPERRPVYVGAIGTTYGVAAVLGPVLGGVFSDRVTWRWCFYINLPIGIAATAVILLLFKVPGNARITVPATWREKLLQTDPVGVALTMAAIICFILAMQAGGQSHPWNSGYVIGLLVASIILMILLVPWEIFQKERAMVVPRLIKQRFLWSSSIYQFCYGASYNVLLYYLPIYFQSVDNVSPIESGVRNLPMVIAVSLGNVAGGFLMSKTGYPVPPMIAGAAIATVSSGLFYTLDIGTSDGKWIGYQILAGVAWSIPFQYSLNIAQANVEPQDISSATAIIFFAQIIGQAFALSAAQSAFVNVLINYLSANAPHISTAEVITTGATGFRTAFPPDQVLEIVRGYMEGVRATFAVAIGLAGVSFLSAFLVPFRKMGGGKPETPAGE